jgi:hypothetical protein
LQGERALACATAAVIDLQARVAALQAACEQAEWEEAIAAAIDQQLPLLRAWRARQVRAAVQAGGVGKTVPSLSVALAPACCCEDALPQTTWPLLIPALDTISGRA